MNVRPILSALKKHRIAALLIVVEIALAFAIASNAVYVVAGRLARMDLPSGLDEQSLVLVRPEFQGGAGTANGQTEADLAALRAIPGVGSASEVNSLPLAGIQWGLGYAVKPQTDFTDGIATPDYFGGPDLLRTLGVRLLQGSAFAPSDYQPITPKNALTVFTQAHLALVTQAYAQRLWPGQDAVGKTMYAGHVPVRVLGVVSNMLQPYIGSDAHDPSNYYGVFLPLRQSADFDPLYVLHTRPADRERVLKAAVARLQALHPTGTIGRQETYAAMRGRYFRNDRSMAWLLLGSIVALLAVTAVGIVGLASFWVQQRTRQIGVRRALGARRADILRYFLLENFLLATFGIALGCAAAISINVWLMAHYAVPRLPLAYLGVGALALWTLGQAAVMGPAARAASISPATAVRFG